jgi:hypothetical protein
MTGIIFVIAGVTWHFGKRFGLGTLPGDFYFKKGPVAFYFPLATCIIISIIGSVLLWLFRKF